MGQQYDLVILGAGPGGYVAAIRAAQLGLKTALVEEKWVGGVCLNIGCIPSKALIHQAAIYRSAEALRAVGISVDTSGFSYASVWKKSRTAAERLSRGVRFLLKKNGVTLFEERGRLTGVREVTLAGGTVLSGTAVLVATGSQPRQLPGFPFDHAIILSSDDALMLQELPASVLIVGGGPIGLEFAHILSSFGVQVRLVELLDQLLPGGDREVAALLRRSFARRNIEVTTSCSATGMKPTAGGLSVTLQGPDGEETVEVEKLLVVAGRVPNTEGIGLEETGVRLDRGFVVTGDYCETSVPGLYAIGDITGPPLLAHRASRQGEIVAEHIAGLSPPARIDEDTIPGAVFCEPEVATFGYTERRAREEGRSFEKATFPFRGVGKAVAVEESEGFAKVLYDSVTREILGAHLIGPGATEVVHELLLARTAELLPEDIAATIHAHPTLSEVVMELAKAAGGHAIHA